MIVPYPVVGFVYTHFKTQSQYKVLLVDVLDMEIKDATGNLESGVVYQSMKDGAIYFRSTRKWMEPILIDGVEHERFKLEA